MKGIKEAKVIDSIDNWEKGGPQPKDEDIDFLEKRLTDDWSTLIQIRTIKRIEGWEKNEENKKNIEAWEEEFDNFKPRWEKILSLTSQNYLDKKTSSSSQKPTNSTALPWTLAIVFGITTIIAAGAAIYLFWHQRKIKRFKV